MEHFNNQAYLENLRSTPRQFAMAPAIAKGDIATWQKEWREQLNTLLGLTAIRALAATAPVSARSAELREFESYTREKLFVLTEPGIEIPCYLLLPKQRSGPLPLVLAPHGHALRGKEIHVGNYLDEEDRALGEDGERDIALQAVAQGYAVIAPDVRGFYEMSRREDFEKSVNSCQTLQNIAMMYGRTLIGERVHDMGRLIDYAATRPEIDAGRVIITGNSGGGTVSLFTAAIDERIKVAVPGSYFCTFFDSVISIRHCPCNVVPGILRFGEMPDVAGLIAPRPFLALNGRQDEIFPIEATRRAFAQLKELYGAMGHPERCELFEGEGGHRYYKARVWEFVREFLPPAQGN
jgi:dienelactone hydrolase